MTRLFAGATKVVNGPDDAAANQVMPDAIGKDSSGKMPGAVICVGQPMCEFQSSAFPSGNRNLSVS